jgi:hypothetical protein
MFPHRLSEVTADEIHTLIQNEVAESLDFELKATLPTKKGDDDPWLTGGKVGEEARNDLTAEIVAFANTSGGTLLLGIGEDAETKRAKAPIRALRDCKTLAERLHQSITDRIEPKLPAFECAGVVTESDGTSGVVVMRTLESYLAPHRHTQNNHCYTRRNDRAEPMSMLEIQELTRRKARSAEEAESDFEQSAERFFAWIPQQHRRTSPSRGLQAHVEPGQGDSKWYMMWALRVTARPIAPFLIDSLLHQSWLPQIDPNTSDTFTGTGQLGRLHWPWKSKHVWQPRLRSVERTSTGAEHDAIHRITSSGLIERFARVLEVEEGKRPRAQTVNLPELMWNIASAVHIAAVIRAAYSRPTQHFALEIELMNSEPLHPYGYPSQAYAKIPTGRIVFPRYEIGEPRTFDEILQTFDRDLWNAGGMHPNWEVGVNWPVR